MDRIIVGLTGSFGSGCTFIAKNFIENKGYKGISLSKILKEKCNITATVARTEMQNKGNELRAAKGADCLAKHARDLIESDKAQKLWVIDSIRNTQEIAFLRKAFPSFYLIGIFADQEVRWNRRSSDYSGDRRAFTSDDERDKGEEKAFGQQVSKCFAVADMVIINNTKAPKTSTPFKLLESKIDKYLGLINGTTQFEPTESEALMAMAYANSFRSSCLKRKVGAVIVDCNGTVFSSGYNEVPMMSDTCKEQFGECFRSTIRSDYRKKIESYKIDDAKSEKLISYLNEKLKILDYCRALHAEENAIVNVAMIGGSLALRGATLYTTTYPCNLCANKIAQVGIKKIVYFEPYPMQEAKDILAKSNVKADSFEGVTFNGYFKLGGGL